MFETTSKMSRAGRSRHRDRGWALLGFALAAFLVAILLAMQASAAEVSHSNDNEHKKFETADRAYTDCLIGGARKNYQQADSVEASKTVAEPCRGPLLDYEKLILSTDKISVSDVKDLEKSNLQMAKAALQAVRKCKKPGDGADVKGCDTVAEWRRLTPAP